jgi:hypothetical protein
MPLAALTCAFLIVGNLLESPIQACFANSTFLVQMSGECRVPSAELGKVWHRALVRAPTTKLAHPERSRSEAKAQSKDLAFSVLGSFIAQTQGPSAPLRLRSG